MVALTQLIKKNFPLKFERKSDVISLCVSIVVCVFWWLYNTPAGIIYDSLDDGTVTTLQLAIQLLITSFATWLSASKSYDLFIGDKKRGRVLEGHILENKKLRYKLDVVTKGGGADGPEKLDKEDSELSDKLRDILEGSK